MDKQIKELINVLKATLPAKEAKFFGNLARLSTVLELVNKYATDTDIKILDLACGPLVLDFFLENNGYSDIIAIDKSSAVPETYLKLQNKGLLKHTIFSNGSITEISLQSNSRQLVILNDALVYQDIDLPGLLPKLHDILSEGGYLIFDVWRSEFYDKFRKIYDRIYPKYRAFKRYSFAEVAENLDKYGFSMEEIAPWFSTQIARRFVERLLYFTIHLSNTTYFVARKKRC